MIFVYKQQPPATGHVCDPERSLPSVCVQIPQPATQCLSGSADTGFYVARHKNKTHSTGQHVPAHAVITVCSQIFSFFTWQFFFLFDLHVVVTIVIASKCGGRFLTVPRAEENPVLGSEAWHSKHRHEDWAVNNSSTGLGTLSHKFWEFCSNNCTATANFTSNYTFHHLARVIITLPGTSVSSFTSFSNVVGARQPRRT